ncbi:MAG: right-handed parallel beta-helix repeat-containing protein, partial [Planctomycetota bacterium]
MFKLTNRTTCLMMPVLLPAILCCSAMGKIIYVDDDAAGVNDGSSWENAYIFLQDALADANSTEKPVEIRVAQGIYMPDQGAGITRGDHKVEFKLISAVTVLGGFAGAGVIESDARNIEVYKTILSGDLAGDDAVVDDPDVLSHEPTRAENSSIVVLAKGTDETVVLDGVTVTAGYAGMIISHGDATVVNCAFTNAGLGLDISDSSAKITNCTFESHWSHAIAQSRSSLTVTDCMFTGNSGISIQSSFSYELVLHNCTFVNNVAKWKGGAISCSFHENLRLYNCKFSRNVLGSGFCLGFDAINDFIAENCTFSGNVGGAIKHTRGRLVVSNCVFSGNIEDNWIGGIFSLSRDTTIQNCTFSSNSVARGSSAVNARLGAKVSDCIFWDNSQPAIDGRKDKLFVRYCNVQGGWPGEGNVDVDPYFVMPGYWDQNGTPEDINDDFWVDGDYHLKSEAGRWDPVSESWVIDDVTSPCIDAGDPDSPVAFEPFANGGIINMGAYGGTAEAGKSPSGIPAKYGGGTGEPNDPYLIYTAGQMNTIGAEPNDWEKHFKLMADIDLKDFGDSSFNLIGSESHPFMGVFD